MKKVDGYLVIRSDNKTLDLDDVYNYLEDCKKNDKIKALHNLIITKFDLNKNVKLKNDELYDYISTLLKSNNPIEKNFDDKKDIYTSFYEAIIAGINNLSYYQSISNLSKTVASLGRSMVEIANMAYKSIFNDTLTKYVKELAKSLLPYKSESTVFKKNVEKLIKYGWVVTLEIEKTLLFNKISNRKDVNQIICGIYDDTKIKKIEKEIKEYLKFDSNLLRYFKEAKKDYVSKSYYSCAAMEFAIIDRLISMNSENRNIGHRGVNNLKELLINEDYYNEYINYSTICILTNLFEHAKDFTLSPNIFNRNMLDHGWMKRNIKPYECLQLLLVIQNLLYILNKETNIMQQTLENYI